MYERFLRIPHPVDGTVRRKMAERLFEMGKRDLESRNYPRALQWLEYAIANVADIEDAELSKDTEDLRLAIYERTVRTFIAIGGPGDIRKATDLVEYLQSRLGDDPVVLLLRVSLLECMEPEEFDVDAFGGVLRKMARSFRITTDALDWTCAKLLSLHGRRPLVAVSILDDLISSRILATENEEWITKTLVLRTRMSASEDTPSNSEQRPLHALFSKVLDNLAKPLSTATVTAIQSVGPYS